MSRSSLVQYAMNVAKRTASPPDGVYDINWASLQNLAAEVERLEAELIKANERVAKVTRIMYSDHIEKMAKAEARVKELERELANFRNAGGPRSAIADSMQIMRDHADHYYEQWEAAQKFNQETKGAT
jgi:hypothetical protein